ncbi:MAG: DUF1598 domain-containing protein [Planctomycetales bacterium]|nr:DUF1598 domain-containing protein [Planctomycetales bacterium]
MDRFCRRGWLLKSGICLLLALVAAPCLAQTTTTTDTTTDTGTDTGTDTAVVVGNLPGAGVVVDAAGVLSIKRQVDNSGTLDRNRRREAVAALGRDLAKPSDLRKVSLNRLEAAVTRELREGRRPSEEMAYLAGMTSIRYVFYYPETHDIVLAGPAEGFMIDELGRPVGIVSGRAMLQLEDLIVALRTFGPDGHKVGTVGCSIDPTQEGLARMQDFLRSFGNQAVRSDTPAIVESLQRSLGLQTVTINGISPNTHFANILVEADYRMKLIGIGLEVPPVRIRSFVSGASPSAVSRNALQRWYFVPDYESVRVSDDGNAVELIGDGVKLVGADEVVRADGTRQQTKRSDRASKAFVDSFTNAYPQLASKMPVYAQLRNLIDMLVASAYIQQQDFYGQAEWSMETFGNEQVLPVEIYAAAKQVDTAVNAIWKGNTLMTPIGGGVHINPLKAISAEHIQSDEEGTLAAAHDKVEIKNLADGQWWWD